MLLSHSLAGVEVEGKPCSSFGRRRERGPVKMAPQHIGGEESLPQSGGRIAQKSICNTCEGTYAARMGGCGLSGHDGQRDHTGAEVTTTTAPKQASGKICRKKKEHIY